MNHTDALNKILSHSCSNPAYYPDDGKTHEYEIDLCCEKMYVIAQPQGDSTYNIIDVLTNTEWVCRHDG